MDEVIEDQPAGRQIHVILDNLSTHKKNDDWLAAHPNVTFHFTPTSASWLNQVEIWFGIFQRKTLNNASFRSIEQLTTAIHDFTVAYNVNACLLYTSDAADERSSVALGGRRLIKKKTPQIVVT